MMDINIGPHKPLTSAQLERVARKYCAIQSLEPDEVITETQTQRQMQRWKALGRILREHDGISVLVANERESSLLTEPYLP